VQPLDLPITAFGRGMRARRALREIMAGVVDRRLATGDLDHATDFVGSLLKAQSTDTTGLITRCVACSTGWAALCRHPAQCTDIRRPPDGRRQNPPAYYMLFLRHVTFGPCYIQCIARNSQTGLAYTASCCAYHTLRVGMVSDTSCLAGVRSCWPLCITAES
jgi:cytochrome P450